MLHSSTAMKPLPNADATQSRLKAFPVAWVTTCRRILIAGGGFETASRVRNAILCDWIGISVVMPSLTPEVRELARRDLRIALHERQAVEQDVAYADFVVEDSDDEAVATRIRGWCDAHGKPLNACDKPDLCDVYYMSLYAQGQLAIGITTGGDAPAVSSLFRKWMEANLSPGWAMAVRLMGETRRGLPGGQARMNLLKELVRNERFLPLVEDNDEAGLRELIADAIRRMPV